MAQVPLDVTPTPPDPGAGEVPSAPARGTSRSVGVLAAGPGGIERRVDRVAAEVPLQIRVDGEPFSITMRTPGDDEALAVGFLIAERVIASRADLVSVQWSAAVPDEVDVRVRSARPLAAARRLVTTTAACGMCGRQSLESVHVDGPPLAAAWRVSHRVVTSLPETLRHAQTVFEETGGLHAAGLFRRDGSLAHFAEDVGRHNAVDKVVGRLALDGRLPLADYLLMVSGRTSFEIVQKAWFAGIPFVAAVSAPSTLAIDLAERGGMTLLGFVRGTQFNIYAHPQRLDEA